MKLLNQAVLVPVPPFKVATEDGVFDVDFSIIFKRITESDRKKRIKKIMDNVAEAAKIASILDDKQSSIEAIEKAKIEIAENDSAYDKDLFNDIVGWKDLFDTDGSEVEYSVKEKKLILDSPPFIEAIHGIWKAADGGVALDAEAEANLKN